MPISRYEVAPAKHLLGIFFQFFDRPFPVVLESRDPFSKKIKVGDVGKK